MDIYDIDNKKIVSLRMERQCLICHANESEYIQLYRDLQPGVNVYWNGFGDPPSLTFRADFNDIEFNRHRQAERKLVKGRFAGGNIGWIESEEMELFSCLYRKPINMMSLSQLNILELIERQGPLTIQQIKEETGMLVKDITAILHRLQEAFLIYEDQYDGEWDRGWYMFSEIFPELNFKRYSQIEALKIVLQRFAYRNVVLNVEIARSFYKISAKEIKSAINELVTDGIFVSVDSGFMLKPDTELLCEYKPKELHFVYAIHRNDFLYKSNEQALKKLSEKWLSNAGDVDYDREMLQYLLIDGEFHGACVGYFRNGPYDLNDVICDLQDPVNRKDDIISAVTDVNYGKAPKRFMGKEI